MDERRPPPRASRAHRSRPTRREAEFELPGAEGPVAGSSGESGGTPAELASSQGASMEPQGAMDNGSVQELARAFQANAEALQGMHEVHARLSETLERNDRSEMVLQSTSALNDTFRNLTHVQRALLTEVKDGKPAKKGGGRLVPLMLLGLLVVLLGGIYAVIVALEQRPGTDTNVRGLGAEDIEIAANQRLAILEEGRQKGLDEGAAERRRLKDVLDEMRGQITQLRDDLDESNKQRLELERQRATLEAEGESLGEKIIELRHAKEAGKALEVRIRTLEGEKMKVEARLEATDLEVRRVRAQNTALRTKLAAYGMDLPDEDIAAIKVPDLEEDENEPKLPKPVEQPDPKDFPELPTPEGAAAGGPVDPSAVPPPAGSDADGGDTAKLPQPEQEDFIVRDPGRRDNVRRALDQLMSVSAPPGQPSWRVAGIGGLNARYLADVILRRYDAGGGLVSVIRAKEMYITVDRATRTVDVLLRDGAQVAQGGKETPLPDGGARVRLASGRQLTRMWQNSGLKMIDVK